MAQEFRTEMQGGMLAQLMAFVAGFVDAVGYIVLFHMFTANMSGNSVGLGIHIGQGQWGQILHRLFPIPLFMCGVIAGSFLIVILKRAGKRMFPPVLLFEAGLIVLFVVAGRPDYSATMQRVESRYFYAIAGLLPLAMGVQTAILHRVGDLSLRTTFVTGMISTACRQLVNYLFWIADHWKESTITSLLRRSWKQQAFVSMALTGGIWLWYMAGAIAGGASLPVFGLANLSLPAGLLILASVTIARANKGSQDEGESNRTKAA